MFGLEIPLYMYGYFGILLMLVLAIAGMPMAYAMCGVAAVGLSLTLSPWLAATQTMMVAWTQAKNFSLLSIPLFIFMGTIAFRTGIVSELFAAMKKWVGWLPGGLAASGVLAGAGFGAVTGSTAAAAVTFGSTIVPELGKAGYNQRFVAGTMAACAGFGAILPPSVFVIIYAVLTDQSPGQMFIAIVNPGLLAVFLFVLYCVVRCWINPSLGGSIPRATWKERILALPAVIPVVIVFGVVIGSIFMGLATPTEAAAFGVLSMILVAAGMGRLKKDLLATAFREGAKMSAAIFFLFIGGWLMSRFLVTCGTTRHMVNTFVNMNMGYYELLVWIFILLLVIGTVLESTSLLILTMPILYPIIMAYGVDPIWFGAFVTFMMALAGITPPTGLNVFCIRGVCQHIPLTQIFIGAAPFVVIYSVIVLIMIFFPNFVMAPVHAMTAARGF